jgi:hypothetical protein
MNTLLLYRLKTNCDNPLNSNLSLLFQNHNLKNLVQTETEYFSTATCPVANMTAISQGARTQRQNIDMWQDP